MENLTPLQKHDRDLAEHAGRASDFRAHIAGAAAAALTIIACIAFTYFSHFTFGFFKVVFGVVAGVFVKHIGRGTGVRFGILAGTYAVVAVIGYEMMLSAFFIASDDPSSRMPVLPDREAEEAFMAMTYSFSHLVRDAASAAVAFVLAYRIGKNPMKKDELDYLLEAKFGGEEAEKYSGSYFKKKRRR